MSRHSRFRSSRIRRTAYRSSAIFYIYSEDSGTGAEYFQRTAHENSRVKVKILHSGKNLSTLITKANRRISHEELEEGDKLFVVSDKDEATIPDLEQAYSELNSKAQLLLSNPSFEAWIILHFQNHLNGLSSPALCLSKAGQLVQNYSKSNFSDEQFNDLKYRQQNARDNARNLAEQCDSQAPIRYLGSDLYKFIDELEKL